MSDPLAATLTESALASLDARIAHAVDTHLRELLPDGLERARSSLWLDTKAAVVYLGSLRTHSDSARGLDSLLCTATPPDGFVLERLVDEEDAA
jgi:hypothetical protein